MWSSSGSILFSVFIGDLERRWNTLTKFADSAKLGSTVNMHEGVFKMDLT